MKIEVRSDGAHISGYVNAVKRESLPVITPHGRVNEEIEPGAFAAALERGTDIPLTVDHEERVYASTGDGTMQLQEDKRCPSGAILLVQAHLPQCGPQSDKKPPPGFRAAA